jgi:hypothetical protein
MRSYHLSTPLENISTMSRDEWIDKNNYHLNEDRYDIRKCKYCKNVGVLRLSHYACMTIFENVKPGESIFVHSSYTCDKIDV